MTTPNTTSNTSTSTAAQRGPYNEILLASLDAKTREAIRTLVQEVSNADKIDEHGGWDFGIERISRSRSRSLNWDLYGYGNDVHSGQLVAVIQVREWSEGPRLTTVRKSYFLCGHNEDGTAFAHPVSHGPVLPAIRAGRDVVLACQNWIFGGDYAAMRRQGDLAVVPMKSRPAGTKGQTRRTAVLEESHRIDARQIAVVDGRVYAKSPTLTHLPGTHPVVQADGWCRIIVGQRAKAWDFAAPTVD